MVEGWHLNSSNRTFMELKWHRRMEFKMTTISSNRTFMELKSYRSCASPSTHGF